MPDESKSNWWHRAFEWLAETWSLDVFLSVVEAVTVLVLAVAVYSVLAYEFYWVVRGSEMPTRQARLAAVLSMFNQNWKAGLLLLIPLFYRTVRKFLERVEEVFGMKARPPEAQPKEAPNPPQREN